MDMRIQFPQFTAKKHGGRIEFIGELIVKPEFPPYKISIMYRGKDRPYVKVLTPKLVERPPHFYHTNGTLCLYHPKNYKWYKDRLVSKDIIPWAAGWIYFYEVWLKTGKWFGPEAEHDINKRKDE